MVSTELAEDSVGHVVRGGTIVSCGEVDHCHWRTTLRERPGTSATGSGSEAKRTRTAAPLKLSIEFEKK